MKAKAYFYGNGQRDAALGNYDMWQYLFAADFIRDAYSRGFRDSRGVTPSDKLRKAFFDVLRPSSRATEERK